MIFDQSPTEFYCSHDDSSFKPLLMGKKTDEPWVQVCITGDDRQDLNLNMSLENVARLQESLKEFLSGLEADHG